MDTILQDLEEVRYALLVTAGQREAHSDAVVDGIRGSSHGLIQHKEEALCSSFVDLLLPLPRDTDCSCDGQKGKDSSSRCCETLAAAPEAEGRDDIRQTTLQKKLAELTAQHGSIAATLAQREVDLSCAQASTQILAQDKAQLMETVSQLQRQLADAQQDAGKTKIAMQEAREQCQSGMRDLALLRQEARATEAQWDALAVAVAELQRQARVLAREKAGVVARLKAGEAECTRLRAALSEAQHAQARVQELEAELATYTAERHEVMACLRAAKEKVESGAAYWASVREEHETLKSTLALCEEVNAEWERRLLASTAAAVSSTVGSGRACQSLGEHDVLSDVGTTESCPAPTPHMPPTPSASQDDQGEEEEEEEDADEARNAFTASLEAKALDLALSLNETQQQLSLARRQYTHIASARVAETAELSALRAIVSTTSKPAMLALTQQLDAAQAARMATDSFATALLQLYHELLEAYTEEVLHCHELEAQLALLATRAPAQVLSVPQQQMHRMMSTTTSASELAAATLAHHQHQSSSRTAMNVHQQQQQPGATPFSSMSIAAAAGMVDGGTKRLKQQTMRYGVLQQQREREQQRRPR